MTDIEPRNWNYYTMYIRSVIHGVMQEMGYSEEQIGQYFKMSGDATVTKTHGRKSVGGINRMVRTDDVLRKKRNKFGCWYRLPVLLRITNCSLTRAIL